MKRSLFNIIALPLSVLLIAFCSSCKNHHETEDENEYFVEDSSVETNPEMHQSANSTPCIKLYVENSGSMFGYVSNQKERTNFCNVIENIARDKDFDENIETEFYFISGSPCVVNKQFKNKNEFIKSLTPSGMQSKYSQSSDLNGMLNKMLEGANGDTITILISDGIYDIGTNNIKDLQDKGGETQETFRRTLRKNKSIQTMVVKMESMFNGNYCYATKKASTRFDNNRPYFIWIFGNKKIVDRYFPDSKVMEWSGYKDHARFQTTEKSTIPYVLTSEGQKGIYKIRGMELTNCKARHNEFAFSIIADYESLAFPDDYLKDIKNYTCGNNFKVIGISEATKQNKISAGVSQYTRPFIITVETDRNPRGTLEIILENNIPAWINSTNADDEKTIDTEHTFGFSTLMKGITGAYSDLSTSQPASFVITFKK